MPSDSETDVAIVDQNCPAMEDQGEEEQNNIATVTRTTKQNKAESEKIHVELNLNAMKISMDYDVGEFPTAIKFIEFIKETLELASSKNAIRILDGLTKQVREQKEHDEITELIRKLVDLNTVENALQELYEELFCADESESSHILNQFIEKFIEFLVKLSDEKCEDSLNFITVIKKSDKFSSSIIFSTLFENFNEQLNAKIKCSAKGLQNEELVRLCLIRAIGIDLGGFNFSEVVTEILENFLKIELGFDIFCAGLQQLAKLIMVGMDEDFKRLKLHSTVVQNLDEQDFSQFSEEGQYQDFLQLIDMIKSQLENKV
eukprot:TRINITY_DN1793_c0_g1_i2.p1 TRINITY_DN1793_c0_g1~~TRINITY_DN1793_c0_g1_i2.p1  ORF type:complete len:317 (-),score=61.26 TRINITY_DN1793_c0_g1_i2:229-1179(-)